MADLLNEDPELQRQFAQKIAAKMGGGMGNFMSAAMAAPQAQPPMENPRMPFNMASQSEEGAGGPKVRREMRGPSGVDDILRAFEAERAQAEVPIFSKQSGVFTPSGPSPESPRNVQVQRQNDPMSDFMVESADERSIGTASTFGNRRGRKRQPVQTVGAELTLNV